MFGVALYRRCDVTMDRVMASESRLLAWIENENDQVFMAYFVSSISEKSRLPAISSCISRLDAQRWIEGQAAELSLPVEWVSPPG